MFCEEQPRGRYERWTRVALVADQLAARNGGLLCFVPLPRELKRGSGNSERIIRSRVCERVCVLITARF